MWALDPVDGTKGFLRGGQYAVCLALIVDAQVELGIIGCPNLPLTSTALPSPSSSSSPLLDRGALFVAVRGQGAESRPLSNPWSGSGTSLRLSSPACGILGSKLRFLESVESGHSALDFNERVAELLGVTAPPERMDSQAKYCVLARGLEGEGNVYLRMPVKGYNYLEKIWVSFFLVISFGFFFPSAFLLILRLEFFFSGTSIILGSCTWGLVGT